eukprot:397315-Prymnesium_polylepis.1
MGVAALPDERHTGCTFERSFFDVIGPDDVLASAAERLALQPRAQLVDQGGLLSFLGGSCGPWRASDTWISSAKEQRASEPHGPCHGVSRCAQYVQMPKRDT